MLEDIHENILQSIQHLSQHSIRHCEFSTKKNDQLLENFFNNLMQFAQLKKCSDIHLEPQERNIRIRLRIDGVLSENFYLPTCFLEQLCCKIKILANMNISQTRLPQDGKFVFESNHTLKSHIRVSTCPIIYGEKIVLRLLNDDKKILDLEQLGMSESQLKLFKQAISCSYGLILITGPTGSGKTSTLYSGLNYINSATKNITTLEDPVEVYISGINQVNIKGELGFASLLRSILRQDPDVIMIGEIRDEETAQIAIQAANTGHLVFATLHTNNCIETINRLKNMSIDQNDLISCLRLIVSQRLLRKKTSTKEEYAGRIGVFELLTFDDNLKKDMTEKKYYNAHDLIENHHFFTMNQQALEYLHSGITTQEEITRVLND